MRDAINKIALFAGSAALALTLSVAGAQRAEAAVTFTACVGSGYNILDNVANATGCGIDPTNSNDSVSPPASGYTVNVEQYFGINEWLFLGKNDPPPSGVSGTYDFTAFGGFPGIADTGTLMLVFKDGAGTTLVAYTVSATSGAWSSPFEDPPFAAPGGSPKNVSHISYYYTLDDGGTNPDAVPEPMTLALFGLGLAGLGAVARRRRAA